ncbi:hypothetical protein Q7C_1048 [Methylophaga frappieri]|uniref:Uncharacterized protein n=1 Tax=Methylophaga frappieri (strain ATCC BAA-2434 / DSM 25690 / JAM7) TaxID=754477 RepID=I1YH14_METFJ|nr:hypothetical protein Q7C_1048 [Methylophaga frappieri]
MLTGLMQTEGGRATLDSFLKIKLHTSKSTEIAYQLQL